MSNSYRVSNTSCGKLLGINFKTESEARVVADGLNRFPHKDREAKVWRWGEDPSSFGGYGWVVVTN